MDRAMTDNTQELDEIVSDLILDLTSEVGWQEVQAGVKAGLAIRDWHNKQTLELLDRLDKSMPTAEQLATKYGYHMPEKQYGYKLALHDIRETIEVERNKLKEIDG